VKAEEPAKVEEPAKADEPPKAQEPAETEEPAKAEEPVKAEEPAEADEPPADEPDEAPPLREQAANEPPRAGSSGWMIILAIAAAIVLIAVYVKNGDSDGGDRQAATKPNDKGSNKPAPRPPVVKTRAGDPAAEALRNKQLAVKAETSETEETGDEAAETGAVEPTPTQPDDPVEPPPVEPEPRPHVENPRDPSLIPPGTPVENAKAFAKLPVAPSDGPPLGGIGRTGIHIDQIAMGEGRDNNGCEQPSRQFSASGTEFINVCFRVIHPRAAETLRVFWEKDGATTRRGKVRIPEGLHAYKTRAYLQVRPEYVGSWRVRIVPEGEESIDLGVAEFEIVE
jgi:hypothetical protein